jgi:hypothetical protein
VVTLRYHQVVDAVPVVLDLLDRPPVVERRPWRVRRAPEPATPGDAPPDPASADGTWAGSLSILGAAPVEGVVTLVLGDVTVVFDPDTRHLATLNPVAGAVWAALPWEGVDVGDTELAPAVQLVVDLAGRGLVQLGGSACGPLRRAPGLVARRIRDEVLVSDPLHRVARLGGSAAAVWDALDEPRSVLDLARALGDAGRADGAPAANLDPDDATPRPGAALAVVVQVIAAVRALAGQDLVIPGRVAELPT